MNKLAKTDYLADEDDEYVDGLATDCFLIVLNRVMPSGGGSTD